MTAAGISVRCRKRHTSWFRTLRLRVELRLHNESLILEPPRAGPHASERTTQIICHMRSHLSNKAAEFEFDSLSKSLPLWTLNPVDLSCKQSYVYVHYFSPKFSLCAASFRPTNVMEAFSAWYKIFWISRSLNYLQWREQGSQSLSSFVVLSPPY